MGFVKLPNDLTEWAWYNDNNTLAVYIRLILGAAWRDREYKNVHLKRGQIVTTIPQIAEQSNLTVQQVRTVIDRLKSTGKITVERTPKFSIITLIEYDCDAVPNSQNNSPATDNQQSDNSLSTVKQQAGNSQTTDKQQTNNSPATDKQQSYFIINKKTEDNIDRKSESEDADAPAREASGEPETPKSPKKNYAELVTLTEEEYKTLVEKHGETVVQWCIQKLNKYKIATGKTYASDFGAIQLWVLDSYQEEQAKQGQQVSAKPPGAAKQEQRSKNPFLDAVMNDNLNGRR